MLGKVKVITVLAPLPTVGPLEVGLFTISPLPFSASHFSAGPWTPSVESREQVLPGLLNAHT
jgi:hypothetical protein